VTFSLNAQKTIGKKLPAGVDLDVFMPDEI
jgi:hypothetical protein